MSGLAAVLAGRRRAGVYRWASQAAVRDVQHAVEHAGWRFVHLDAARVADKPEFLEQAGEAFGLPGGFGHSFDALLDALSDVHHEVGTVTLWEGWSPFARAHPQQFAVALDVLTQRSDTSRGGAFVVLLRGDGPPLDVAELDPHRS